MNTQEEIAKRLLEIKAVELNTEKPFIWASGIKSPIYCDNRKTLSYPLIRNLIKKSFAEQIKKQYPNVDTIAGVATGGIAIGALVAEELNLPFVYVRSSAKKHGKENLIEGIVTKNQKIVVIEDLISTGGSSIVAVKALQEAGCNVLGLIAIFTYEFETSINNFKLANCQFSTLSNYSAMLKIAVETNYITENQKNTLENWKKNPDINIFE